MAGRGPAPANLPNFITKLTFMWNTRMSGPGMALGESWSIAEVRYPANPPPIRRSVDVTRATSQTFGDGRYAIARNTEVS